MKKKLLMLVDENNLTKKAKIFFKSIPDNLKYHFAIQTDDTYHHILHYAIFLQDFEFMKMIIESIPENERIDYIKNPPKNCEFSPWNLSLSQYFPFKKQTYEILESYIKKN